MLIPRTDANANRSRGLVRPLPAVRGAAVLPFLLGSLIQLGTAQTSSEPAAAKDTASAEQEIGEAAPEPVDPRLEELGSAPYARVLTEPGQRAYLFSIPAPRGLILDRRGLPLARNRTANYLTIRLSQLDGADEDIIVDLVNAALDANPSLADVLVRPSEKRILAHWKHRRGLPLTVSTPLSEELEKELEHSMGPAFSMETVYLRDYPQGGTACHIVGHVSREAPQLDGPVVRGESLWPAVQGRSGMEQMYDELLRGSPGLVSELYDEDGALLSRRVLKAPRPGLTFVTSIDLEMQKLSERILEKKGRPGALVAVDSEGGDILAMASYPSFNPADFVPSMSEAKYRALSEHPDNPFYPRASQAVYPPGSTFKPFVALAALDHGSINGRSLVSGPPAVNIAGRTFHNWNTRHEGMLNVRDALSRSCNTWFYQVGIATGGKAIVDNVNVFGFGRAPDIPIDGTAAGFIPDAVAGKQALANLSIGQGDVLVSPLQMALATAGLANGERVPFARLVLQTQTPPPEEAVIAVQSPDRGTPMNYSKGDLNLVRAGLWSAVNGGGTGGSASVGWPQVSGKTGTAQWGPKREGRNVAWFTGFMNARQPRIAIAVAIEGKPYMSTAGGRHAAPLAGEFLNTLYRNPQHYAVTVPDRSEVPVMAATSSPRASRSMIQISPRPVEDLESLRYPPPGAAPAPAPQARTRTPSQRQAAPPPQPQKRGGFFSRLRSLFRSSE